MLCFYIIQISLSCIVYAVLTYCLHILFFFSIWSYFLKILFHKYFPVFGICFLALLLSYFFCWYCISFLFLIYLFILIGGKLLFNIVVVFAIHWHESAVGVHVLFLYFIISYLLLLKVSYDVHYLVFFSFLVDLNSSYFLIHLFKAIYFPLSTILVWCTSYAI